MKFARTYRFLISIGIIVIGMYCFAAATIVVYGLRDDLAIAEVAIVPGTTVERDGTPSMRLAARLDKAIELYRERYAKNIIVSGARGEEGWNEAVVMRDYLLARGVPDRAIVTDTNGSTSYSTAATAARIMKERGWANATIVSQYFHIPRMRLALSRFGISDIYSAHADFFEPRDIYSALREVAGYFDYLFRSYEQHYGTPASR